MTGKKKTPITIRPALATDLPACLQLDHSQETQVVWQMKNRDEGENTHISFHTLRLPRPIRVEYPRQGSELQLELAGLQGVLVAEVDQVVIGYTHVVLTDSDRSAWVRNLVVDAPVRRRRIGTALFEQAKAWAQFYQARHITFETTIRCYPAIRFFLGRGLIFCGFNDRYYTSQDIAVFFGQNL